VSALTLGSQATRLPSPRVLTEELFRSGNRSASTTWHEGIGYRDAARTEQRRDNSPTHNPTHKMRCLVRLPRILAALAGGQHTLKSKDPILTVGSYWPYATTVWDYTRRAMPYQRPGTLTPNETYAVTAFILFMNGIVDQKMELNEKNLPKIKMPNQKVLFPIPVRMCR
jgi:hypothetical protein